jgi:hypothetical protein
LSPLPEDVIAMRWLSISGAPGSRSPSRPTAAGYRAESLNVLFGRVVKAAAL